MVTAAGASDATWVVLLLASSLVVVAVADPLGAAEVESKNQRAGPHQHKPIKHSEHCGDNKFGVCQKGSCDKPFFNWRQGRNRCRSGETCCRRTTSYEIKCITCNLSGNSQQYFTHPSDCRKFLQCSPSGPKEMPCPAGTRWDQSLLTCNHESNTACTIAQYINSDGSCKTEDDWCQMDLGCKMRSIACRKLMCGTLPSNFRKHMKECALEMGIVLPERDHPAHNHTEHPHHISECGRPYRPSHPSQHGIMQLLGPSVATDLRQCILTKNGIIKSWDGLVNRGVMLANLYPPFLNYPELVDPIKEAIETTCQEPVDYEIHDFYTCVHKTCVDNIALRTP